MTGISKEQAIPAENKMGTQPLWSLLITMALPVILSTAAQSLYNIVDAIFVSRMGENALAAITFSGPLVTVIVAIGSGIAVGMNTMLSRGLGEKKQEHVNAAATTAIFLGIASYVLILLASRLLIRPYMATQTGNTEILEYGAAYLSVYLGLGFGTIGQLVFERMLIATGKTLYSMISQITGAVVNLILDPLLIFGLFGFPELGIAGAAIATVIGQLAATGIAIYFNLTKNKEVCIRLSFKPPLYAVKRVLIVGVPTMLLLSLSSIMIVNFNTVLNRFSSTAVAVFGACSRVTGFFYALINALCSATVPIIAYNYGARNKPRIDAAIRYGYLYGIVIMIAGTILCVGFPELFLRLFNATEEMIRVGVWGMRMLCCCYILVSVRIMSATVVQALGHGFPSMAVDITRNYLMLIPLAWLFSMSGELDLVWLSIPAADTAAAIVGVILMIHYYKKEIKPLGAAIQQCTEHVLMANQ